jgi:Conserved TM helix
MDASLAPQHLDIVAAAAWTWLVEFLPRLVAAVAILAGGALVSRWASKLTTKSGKPSAVSRPPRRNLSRLGGSLGSFRLTAIRRA